MFAWENVSDTPASGAGRAASTCAGMRFSLQTSYCHLLGTTFTVTNYCRFKFKKKHAWPNGRASHHHAKQQGNIANEEIGFPGSATPVGEYLPANSGRNTANAWFSNVNPYLHGPCIYVYWLDMSPDQSGVPRRVAESSHCHISIP